MRRRLLVHHPRLGDATSFWRAAGPFSQLRVPGWDVILADDVPDWTTIASVDAVFMQRPFSHDHMVVAKCVRSLGRKLWIDYDDALFDVPVSNPSFGHYHKEKTREAIASLLCFADLVTFSTADLCDRMRALLPKMANSVVIPNAWNDGFAPTLPKPFAPHKRIFWRGTCTHDEDVEAFLPDMVELAKRHPDWEWVFIGQPPWRVMQKLHEVKLRVREPMPIIQYFNALKTLECSVAIVPLTDSVFNRSKSNIAWQEATFAGCAVVAPNWREWDYPGIVHYMPDGRGFQAAVEHAMDVGAFAHKQSWRAMTEHRMLSNVNKMRAALLETLVG